ncbi:MAG TPA: SLATT domain-containing protein [Solirubrobacteraceae bacterium]|nr:SLATT domain-containing protein [Solirubrobacteraceae bacterium]
MSSELASGSFARPSPDEREGRITFRVRIGVTGHRQSLNAESVVVEVRKRFAQVRELFPPSEVTPVAFTLLTGLAEGADRVVAREALTAFADAGVELEAVLPLTVADYVEDFTTEGSREEFAELLGLTTRRVELARATKPRGRERDLAYQRAGYYIADHCDVMIAVWDGRPPHNPGGTADVVGYSRAQGVPILIVPSAGARQDTDRLDGVGQDPRSVRHLEDSIEVFRRLDEYNRLSINRRRLSRQYRLAQDRLQGLLARSSLSWQLRPVVDWAAPHLVRADALALRYQSRYRNLGTASYFLAAAAVAVVAAQTVFAPTHPGWLGFEIGLLAVLMGSLWIGRRGRLHERWVGYRSLAEAFRSAPFIVLSGARQGHAEQSEAEVVELNERWHQRAFSEVWRQRPKLTLEGPDAPEMRRFIVSAWIDDQIGYHREKAKHWRRQRNLYTGTVYAFAVATIIVAALHIVGWAGLSWIKLFAFLAIVLPGFGAAVTGLRDHGRHRLNQERSMRTAERLERLKIRLEQRTGLASVRHVTGEVQRVIAEENLDWSGVIEFQDLEMVI